MKFLFVLVLDQMGLFCQKYMTGHSSSFRKQFSLPRRVLVSIVSPCIVFIFFSYMVTFFLSEHILYYFKKAKKPESWILFYVFTQMLSKQKSFLPSVKMQSALWHYFKHYYQSPVEGPLCQLLFFLKSLCFSMHHAPSLFCWGWLYKQEKDIKHA